MHRWSKSKDNFLLRLLIMEYLSQIQCEIQVSAYTRQQDEMERREGNSTFDKEFDL